MSDVASLDFRLLSIASQDFSVDGKYSFEVTSMPNVCGTPDSPFEVKIVSEAVAGSHPHAWDSDEKGRLES